MKYIIMCGGNYNKFEIPKQLLKVNGEVLVERTIRLLKENGIKDIAISTNNPAFDYLDVPKLVHENNYLYGDSNRNKKSQNSWLNAYYPYDKPACYLHGDVYFSENAIKTIVETKIKDTMFFCIRDLQDGRPVGVNPKGREPLAYKVENQKVFRQAINDIFQMIDEGKYKDGIEPIAWHLYRRLNGLDMCFNAKGYNANAIFNTKGDYIYIDDYTTDIDFMKDIPVLEEFIKRSKEVENMVKVKVIKDFRLGKFNEIKNLVRANKAKNTPGYLYINDLFECSDDMAGYLMNIEGHKNPANAVFISKVPIEVKPDNNEKETKVEEIKEEIQEEKPKRVTRRRRSVAKK